MRKGPLTVIVVDGGPSKGSAGDDRAIASGAKPHTPVAPQPRGRALEVDARLSLASLSPQRQQALCALAETCRANGDAVRGEGALREAEQIATRQALLEPQFVRPLAAAQLTRPSPPLGRIDRVLP